MISHFAFSVLLVALGIGLISLAITRLRRRRFLFGTSSGLAGLALLLAGSGAGLIGLNLLSYHRLVKEQPAVELQFSQKGINHYVALLIYPTGTTQQFDMLGDQWEIQARLLKWRARAILIGFDTAYRLERIEGRYTDIESERTAPRSVYALSEPQRIDIWELAKRYQRWIPWVDAVYGSASYLPMADQARYQVMVSQSGLVARPLNPAAERAIGGWR